MKSVKTAMILMFLLAGNLLLSAAIPASERQALIDLYNSTHGDAWTNKTGWKTAPLDTDGFAMPGTENTWYGVTTNANGVEQLNYYNNNLAGPLPASFGNLSNLNICYIDVNKLSGSIPAEIGKLTNVYYLSFCSNQLTGSIPAEFGNLSKRLKTFELDTNQLTGSIPASLGKLTNLSFLSLMNNQLSGSIPTELGNLINLSRLYLGGGNLLSGSIPSSFGALTKLTDLRLDSNQLTGSIPSEFGNLYSLWQLQLGSNHLLGSIPTELGNLPDLAFLNLSSNQLSGSIPASLGALTKLTNLCLNSNKLSGIIPTSLTNLTQLIKGGYCATDIGYNALHTSDAGLIAFLNTKDPDWATTQTIAPTNVSAVPSSGSVNVSWTPITYTSGPGGYRVFYATLTGGPYVFFGQTANKNPSSLSVTGLTPGTPYYFVVRTRTDVHAANQSVLDSENSAEVSATPAIPGTVTVTSPNGNESWVVGSSHNITWTLTGTIANVKIEYSTDSGLSYTTVIASTANTGSYAWTVPNTPSTTCLVRVSDASNAAVNDVSNAFFTLTTSLQAQFNILHSFSGSPSDGANAAGSLIADGATQYGMTVQGGKEIAWGGTLFKINRDGSGYNILYEFDIAVGDGAHPEGSLVLEGTTLYGFTRYVGIFKINTDGSGFKLLHQWDSDGGDVHGSPIICGSVMFGMTALNGAYGKGTIFKMNTDGTGYEVLHSFSGGNSDGNLPDGSLIVNGNILFGMSQIGGIYDKGVIFKINNDGTGFTLLHSFSEYPSDGRNPHGDLLFVGTTLYGMTLSGGAFNGGTVFKINPDGSGYQILHSFAGGPNDGRDPYRSLIAISSVLYGMTRYGGGEGKDAGTIFGMNTDGSGYELLHSFQNNALDGGVPYGDLLVNSSSFFGMTTVGGAYGKGTIFSLKVGKSSSNKILTIQPIVRGNTNPSIGSYFIAKDNQISVSAIADTGYEFLCWVGDIPPGAEKKNPILLTMDIDRSIRADYYVPTQQIALSKTKLNFGAISGGSSSSNQTVIINNIGGGTLSWTAASNSTWLGATPGSGTGTGVIQVSVNAAGLAVGTNTGTITVSDPNASNNPQTIAVALTVSAAGSSALPFGDFSTPIDGTTGITGAVPVTGWVLDDIETTKVEINRDPVTGDPPGAIGPDGFVYLGDAVFVEGARPDVAATYPDYPLNYRAGWGYMMLTNFLPNQGNGTFKIYAKATDKEGNVVLLGTKTITCSNAVAVKPFGTIDTPAQGGDASGSSYVNFGWVLTPQPSLIPKDGSTITAWVDGVQVGVLKNAPNAYNQYRADIAGLFPGLKNTDGPVGFVYLNTTLYPNGVHTIYWIVTDDAGHADGIGSRYFNIMNTGTPSPQSNQANQAIDLNHSYSYDSAMNLPVSFEPRRVKKGFDLNAEPDSIQPDQYGVIHIDLREVERVEIDLKSSLGEMRADRGKSEYFGFLVIGNNLRPLPIGSTLGQRNGTFSWLPGPGFLGEYHFLFVRKDRTGGQLRMRYDVKIIPKFNIN